MAILTILAIGSVLLGATGYIVAYDTNEEARQLLDKAKALYNNSYKNFEAARENCRLIQDAFESRKIQVYSTTMAGFKTMFEKVKCIKLKEPVIGMSEGINILGGKNELLVVNEHEDIDLVAIKSGLTGAATGFAGSVLLTGATAGLASVTIVPAALLAGISAELAAEENLDKANLAWAEAVALAEKLETATSLNNAIAARITMMGRLLEDLDKKLKTCMNNCSYVLEKKGDTSDIYAHLTKEELGMFAMCRALAGALKSVLDVSLITEDGTVSDDSKEVYNKITEIFPDLAVLA